MKRNAILRAADRVMETLDRWAKSGLAGPATGLWATIQSSVMPGPSDALLIPLGLASPQKAIRLGIWSGLGAVLGAIIAYWIGALAFNLFGLPLIEMLGFTMDDMAALSHQFATRGWIVIALGLLPLLSSKIIAYAAGALGYPFLSFALITIVLRGGRFLITGAILQFGGKRIRSWLDKGLAKEEAGG